MNSPRGINNRLKNSHVTDDPPSSSSSLISSRMQYVIAAITIGFDSSSQLEHYLNVQFSSFHCHITIFTLIVDVAVGAAIGNIFIMKNRKNFKFKFFKDEAQKAREHQQRYQNQSKKSGGDGSGNNHSSSRAGDNSSNKSSGSRDNTNKRGHRPEENVFEYEYSQNHNMYGIPNHLAESMNILSLSYEKLPTPKEGMIAKFLCFCSDFVNHTFMYFNS